MKEKMTNQFWIAIGICSLIACRTHLPAGYAVTDERDFKTSELLGQISYFWRNDSLASNGYRINTVHHFWHSKMDSVSVGYLLSSLGKPDRERWDDSERIIYYRTFDYTKVGRRWNGLPSRDIYFVVFHFGANGLLQRISELPKWPCG